MATPSSSDSKAVADNFIHSDTPAKTALRTLAKFRDDKKLPISNNDLFAYTGFNKTTGYRVLKGTDSVFNNNPFAKETRGRNPLLSDEQIDQLIDFLERDSEARRLPWTSLCDAAGLEFPHSSKPPSQETLRRALYPRGWKKCGACNGLWTCEDVAEQRERWARDRLHDNGIDLSYYRRIRYLDEIHFKFGAEGKIMTTRKCSTRHCPDCILERSTPREPGDRTVYLTAWACIGYDIKSRLIWLDAAYSNNPQAYLEMVLGPVVEPWLDNGDNFILEDGASGFGYDSHNDIVRQYKESVGLNHFFNCLGAPDPTPIENAWKLPKARHSSWDEVALRKTAEEGWEALKQSTINDWCDSVPFKSLDIVKAEGQYIGH